MPTHCYFQNLLNLPIRHFNLGTGLGMVGSSKPADYEIPLQQGIKRSIIKMGTLITNNSSEHAKSSKDILAKKFHNHFSFIGPVRDSLNPFRNIVHS